MIAASRLPHAPAHPRSRGENDPGVFEVFEEGGSSPLTRGKHDARRGEPFRNGLIPAHAGKTTGALIRISLDRAHPRSRGENLVDKPNVVAGLGSSPLTRGKPADRPDRPPRAGLIPAHAGKTTRGAENLRYLRAHPRSRGENLFGLTLARPFKGSSPLTRGKHLAAHCLPGDSGLIPAHAGKTRRSGRRGSRCRAHPRSRGENKPRAGSTPPDWGSSPLTRGKRRLRLRMGRRHRLIPAHAGKTWCRSLHY